MPNISKKIQKKKFSVYNSVRGIRQVKPTGAINLKECANLIRSDERLIKMTAKLRGIKDAAAQQKYKLLLPYVTFAGIFTKQATDGLIERSEYFMIDLDDIEDLGKTMFAIWDAHKPALMFTSPRGNGIKVVFRIDPSAGIHEEFFTTFRNFFKSEFNLDIDKKCKNISRATFICHDEKVFLAEDSSVFPLTDELTQYNDAVKWTDEQETFKEGNRNQYVTTLAGRCHRVGISEKFVNNQLAGFTENGFPLDGIQRTVKSIYGNKAYAGTADLSKAIMCSVGKLDRMIEETETALLKASPHEIFERDDQVVRIVEQQESIKISSVNHRYLNRIFSRFVTFKKYKADGKIITTNTPPDLSTTYLDSVGTWHLPLLSGLLYAPTILEDGSILDKPGYDEQSGLFMTNNDKFLPVPAKPTREDAQEALKIFDPILVDFKLIPADRSVFLAAALTSLVRQNFIEAPIFGFTAPVRGSGKTLLSNVIHIIATGKYVIPMSEGFSDEESDKQIFATLREGRPVVLIDNIDNKKGIDSKILCTVITASSGVYRGRPLGKSEMEDVSAKVVWLITGNNLKIKSDMTERVLMCTIDPKCEKPRSRSNFEIPKLPKYIKEHRAKIVQALLTLIKAHRVAGCPEQNIPQMGSFENFSEWIREPLVWVGEADPYDTVKEIEDNDPERDWQERLIIYWKELFKYDLVKVSYIMRCCNQAIEEEKFTDKEDTPAYELAQAFIDGISNKAYVGNKTVGLNNQAVGILLSGIQNKIISGYKLVKSKNKSKGSVTWQLTEIQDDLF